MLGPRGQQTVRFGKLSDDLLSLARKNPLNAMSLYRWLLGICALSLVLFHGCQNNSSETTKADKLFSNFHLRYLQADQTYRVEADFEKGDSLHKAMSTAMPLVFWGDSEMPLRNLPNRSNRYQVASQGAFKKQHSFRFEDEVGQMHNHDFELSAIESFAIDGIVSQQKGLTLSWQGPPLQASEDLRLLFSDRNSKAASIEIKGPSEGSRIKVSGDFLKDVVTGPGFLFLVRTQMGDSKRGNIHTHHELSFYTQAITVEILP